jgi:hypothetical protein
MQPVPMPPQSAVAYCPYSTSEELTDATAGVHRGAWERGGVAGGGAGQQAAMPVIGFLSPLSADDDYKNVTVPFLQGLKETGYVEGQNVAVEYRYADEWINNAQLAA